jgi:ATP-dependent Clp protease, protease subunit
MRGDEVEAVLHPVTADNRPDEGEEEAQDQPPRPTMTDVPNSVKERLFKARTLIISGEVNQRLAANVMGQLLAMDADGSSPITIFINSQGGHVESGDTIHDIVQYIRAPVRMIGTGWVASAGALIYVAVPLEQRYSLPNTRFLLHQPAGGARGTASDVEIEAREILKMRSRLNRVFAERTGQTVERIEDDTRRNFWLDAAMAKEYGLVGRIIQNVADLD